MKNLSNDNSADFKIKIIQSGNIKSFSLTESNLNTQFRELYAPLIKELKLSKKDIFFTNDQGKALNNIDLNLPLFKIIEKFGNKINLYYEKIM
ncbi:MAG: hypothetical protein EU535_01985 [Promethearchaeota archaeon]|nr:MAG: hypothetical protein EU535_01985 [Candidatus Lokiarchaeota archaeon]